MKITGKYRKAAKLVWEDNLLDGEIAKEVGISLPLLYKWKKREDFQALLQKIDSQKTTIAKRVMLKHAKRAAKSLVLLTQTQKVKGKGKNGKEFDRFIYNEETVRKACMNILETALVSDGRVYDQETIQVMFSLFFGLVWAHGGMDMLKKIKVGLEKSPQLKGIGFDKIPLAELEDK